MQPVSPVELTAQPRYVIGVITPSGNTVVERVTIAVLQAFPGISCHFSRTDVHGGYDSFESDYDWDSMMSAALLLAHVKPDVMCWNGSKAGSIAFDLDRRLCDRIMAETGCRATTSTLALEDRLRATGARTFGLLSPYTQAYHQKIIDTFTREGYRCVAERHAGIVDNLEYASFPASKIRRMAHDVAGAKPDFIIAWCTNFLGAPLARQIEAETGIPFYDSAALAVWHSLKLLGVDTNPASEWGSLFASEQPVAAGKSRPQ
jgi:maleate isomerase